MKAEKYFGSSLTKNYIRCYTSRAMNGTSSLQFDIESIREIARLVRESELGEICLETTDENEAPARLKLKRTPPPQAVFITEASAPAPAQTPGSDSSSAATSAPQGADKSTSDAQQPVEGSESTSTTESTPTFEITAHVVGVFRHAPVPVEVGDELQVRQILGSVESLRVPNEIVASSAGRVVEILVTEGQGVEYGQPLFIIEER